MFQLSGLMAVSTAVCLLVQCATARVFVDVTKRRRGRRATGRWTWQRSRGLRSVYPE
jgi:hypothetical protein